MEKKPENIKNAATVAEALKNFAENPERIENFIFYLENHFDIWLKDYASTPEDMAAELLHFSTIE